MLETIKNQEEIFWINPKKIPFEAGKRACALQLSDVEEEVNGLLTYDRIPKGDPARFAATAEKIYVSGKVAHGHIHSPFFLCHRRSIFSFCLRRVK